MKTLDCPWEINNIGKTTVEVTIESSDTFNEKIIDGVIGNSEYVVVKVPVNKADFNIGLTKMGFIFIETQFQVSKSNKSFNYNDRLINMLSEDLSFRTIEDTDSLEKVLAKITPDMFSTDRVYIDPMLGADYSCIRYKNWIRSSFSSESVMYELEQKNKAIGFSLLKKQSGNSFDYILGGMYEEYKNSGYGLLTPASPFLYCHLNKIDCNKVETHISSNNLPVVKLYNYLGYSINGLSYVYVKHNILA